MRQKDFSAGAKGFICLFLCETASPLACGGKIIFLPFQNITGAAAPQLFWVDFLRTACNCRIVCGGRLAGAWLWQGSKYNQKPGQVPGTDKNAGQGWRKSPRPPKERNGWEGSITPAATLLAFQFISVKLNSAKLLTQFYARKDRASW